MNVKTVKGFKLFLYYFLQWTWGIVQNLVGLVMRIFLLIKYRKNKKDSFRFFSAQVTEWSKEHGSMGMGMFIFYGHKGEKDENEILVHEYGHTWQSAVLGPFYLLVIGLPSFIWAVLPVFQKMRKEKNIRYTAFYPEAWANKWGTAVTGLPSLDR